MKGYLENLRRIDPDIANAILKETERQEYGLELIASENYVDDAVLEAAGSILTNKYAEGYPHRRYYGGCENMDSVEELAVTRARGIFNAEHANVQPHSGSQANMAAYFALLKPGDTVLGMSLSHGGHLTHGSKVNFSGRLFRFVPYGVSREDERIDFDALLKLAMKERPKAIVVGASAYPRTLPFEQFRKVADEVGAKLIVDMAHIAGLVAGGVHPNPTSFAECVTTTTHKTLRGPRGGMILSRAEFAKEIDSQIFPGIQGGPLMHIVAAKAVCLKEASSPAFKVYQRQIAENAKALGEGLVKRGFRLVTGGTDNHLVLVDLRNLSLTGKEAEERLDLAGITVNKNTIPFDEQGPFITSGIRLGTPAITTRGMKEKEMEIIAGFIHEVLAAKDSQILARVRIQVHELCEAFPLYAEKIGA